MSKRNRTLSTISIALTFLLNDPARAQCRYRDSLFASVNSNDVVYGSNTNFGNPVSLTMRIFRPDGDTWISRPVILLVHGGGFNTGNYVDPRVLEMCRRFAVRGYVTASVQYRLFTQTQINYPAAIYKGVQDIKSAIRFIRNNASAYGIDKEQIFLHGFSAGAIITNHASYWDYNEVADTLKAAYGNFESSGNAGITDSISAVMGWAGAIIDTSWIGDSSISWGGVHNITDPTVSYWGGAGSYGSAAINQFMQNHSLAPRLNTVNIPGMHTPNTGTPAYELFSSFSIDFMYRQLPGTCNVLPVLLIYFRAKVVQGGAALAWRTSAEDKVKVFEIEKSTDGRSFISIGKVETKNLPGEHQFSFSDKHLIPGKNYYRLRFADQDNRYRHSSIISVVYKHDSQVIAIKNPLKERLIVQFKSQHFENSHWIMYDAYGRVIYPRTKLNADINENVSGLPPGVYILEIQQGALSEKIRLVKF